MAIALILFCVFQVMTALSHVTVTSSLPSITPNTTLQLAADMTTDPDEEKHGKRSLNAYPFQPKYLGTETMTLEILENGTVRGVRNLAPEYGVMYFMVACMMETIAPSLDKTKLGHYGKVSLKWHKSNRYLCMNEDGRVYSSLKCTDECQFKQKVEENDDQVLYSLKYSGPKPRRSPFKSQKSMKKQRNKKWYLGIRRTGEMLPGWRTRKKKKYARFIPRPIKDPGYKETRYSLNTTSEPVLHPEEPKDSGGSMSSEERDQIDDVFKNPNPTSQIPKSTKPPRRRRPNKNRHGSRRRDRRLRNQNCDDSGADPYNLFRLNNEKCRRSASKNTRNRGASMPFSSTAFSNQNTRGATSNPAQKQTGRANLFSFSPKR